ncbi:uncharacterized protein LOC108916298 [Anoplophora glabripennis]|uniref:uncharacterized protein LOC108916298 n=1 Tax=Anoplophora glabripennis TaxID=217634 RepID=UPI0008740C6C|nr:uncharacterized protein LOC108916298 [Anoplophora glabripennis]
MEKFVIVKDILKKVRRFNLMGRTLEFKIKPVAADKEPIAWIEEAVNQVIAKGIEDLGSGDQVAFSFCSKDFKRGQGWVRFRPVEQVTYGDVWDIISSIYQSNSTGLDTETFCLGVTTVKMPVGRGKNRSHKYNNFEEECALRKGIVKINNRDNLCLPRALVVAKSYIDKDFEYRKVRRDIGKIQTQRALELCRKAGVSIPDEGAGIPELQALQKHLSGYKIVVYSYGNKGREVIFANNDEGLALNLIHHEGHYNVITSLTAAFCCSYYCERCYVPYNNKNDHRCGGTCVCCQQTPACPPALKVVCDCCKRSFRGQNCYENHRKSGSLGKSTVCEQITYCEKCLKTLKTDRKHRCGEIFCKICNAHVPQDHLCFIQSDKNKPKTIDTLFIFYDLETKQEKQQDDGSLLHEPNLCVFKQCCDVCMNTQQNTCTKCGVRLHVLKIDPITRFVEFLLNQRKLFKQVVVLAHNGGNFDHQFILNHILTKTNLTPELITRGTKLILMEVGNVKFLDSINYFPMALSKLPKAFGLTQLKKGYFPHLFNTSSNQNYKGPMPDLQFYSPDDLMESNRHDLITWHSEKVNEKYIFDFQKEIVEYCISDVEILTSACLKFRHQLLETSNVCPFTEACTIASACNKVFRRNFLRPNTIGIIPKNGYRWRDNQSRIAIQWLVWEEKQRNINIQHAAKGKEIVLGGVKVDGYCSETNHVFEFHGCYYHGCTHCFKYNRNNPTHEDPSDTLERRLESTTAKTDRLRNLGYDVIEMWECDFRKVIKDNKEIDLYTEKHPLLINAPLNPRDAFYGGRTGNTFEYYKAKQGEIIKYLDVCSLYPWVCKYGKFPIGHPQVYIGEECNALDMKKVDGLIKCKILPPQDLYHPVLPQKINNKLMFILCRICGEQMTKSICDHGDDERAITGTWVIDEVLKAVEKGYTLVEIHEVWSYQMQKFDTTTKTEGLFTAMMNEFIKTKQQASGWPKTCSTIEARNKYIEEFLAREDVQLEFNEICENPGLRSLSKLILNSFWGKFGQKENQTKTTIVNTPKEFFDMLTNPSIDVYHALPINENTLIINWEFKQEASDPLATVNVCIAAYTTAQARLKLYSYLEQLGKRVLYYDTDSIIFTYAEEEYEPPVGKFVGDLTDELESYGSGSYITEFASGGPKNYAYKIFSTKDQEEKIVCKVKGISLTYAASQIVNFEMIKNMVLKPSEPVYITSSSIRRTKEHEIITREETKLYRPNSTKRLFQEDHSSVPYGYKKLRSQ